MDTLTASSIDASINSIISQIISGEKLSTTAISALIVARRLKNADLEGWLKLELNGYLNTNSDFNGETVPEYRTVVGNYYDGYNRRIEIQNPALSFVNETRVRYGIEELERLAEKQTSIRIQDAAMFKLIEENLHVTVRTFAFQPTEMIAVLNQIKTQLLTKCLDIETVNQTTIKMLDVSKVFVVHGHDDLAQSEVARFIEKLGFTPVILHEQTSSGKTIIEKIEAYSNVGFGIVLYTPCDVGAVKEQENQLHPRARQNVVFEHGYLIGKLGRPNVCALVKGQVELPNDMSGVVYTPMDSHKAWQYKVADEMKACGYPVDKNKL